MSLLLVLVVGLPLLGAAGLLLLPRATADALAAGAGLVVSGVTLVSSVLTLAAAPWRSAGPDLEIDLPWVPSLGIRLHFVLDGISVPLVPRSPGEMRAGDVVPPPSAVVPRSGEKSSTM